MRLSNWRHHRSLGRPPAVNPAGDTFCRHTGSFGPLGDAATFPPNRHKVVVAAVAILLGVSGPLTVFWFISSTIVQAFDGRSDRALPHVSNEVGELPPSRADADAASTVTTVRGTLSVQASCHDASPDNVLWCPVLSPRRSMRDEGFTFHAAATGSLSRDKSSGRRHDNTATDAAAAPDNRRSIASCRRLECDKVSKLSSSEVSIPGAVGVASSDACACVAHQAAATPRVSCCQGTGDCSDTRATVAATLPGHGLSARRSLNASDAGDDRQSSERHSGQIDDFGHGLIIAYSALTCFPRLPLAEVLS
jgi:hypothetical protein